MDVDATPKSGHGNRQAMYVHDGFAPFNEAGARGADVILRSSDLYDFRVRKAILSEASSVFDVMFGLPQPPAHPDTPDRAGGVSTNTTGFKDGIPVVSLQEDRLTLNRLLRICYPIPKAPLYDIDVLSPVLAASIKYAMDGVTLVIREDLRKLAKQYPVRSYCLAAHHGFLEETRHAARASLDLPRRLLYSSIPWVPELKLVDGKTVFLLLDYHQRCSDAVAHLKSSVPFLTRDWIWFTCEDDVDICPIADRQFRLSDGERITPMNRWSEYMTSIVETLRDAPCGDAILRERQPLDKALKEALECDTCGEEAQSQMHLFVHKLVSYVNDRVAKVLLNLD